MRRWGLSAPFQSLWVIANFPWPSTETDTHEAGFSGMTEIGR
jgi:hypothetical protein